MAQRIDGSGVPGEWLDMDLPLTGAQITDVLSGPPQLSGRIEPVYRRLKASDGRPLLDEWGTVIYAEASGQIRGTGIYTTGRFSGPKWELDGAGLTAYPKGMGYEAEASFVDIDPLDVVRNIWEHLQAGQDSNLGLVVDSSTTTPVRIGTPAAGDSRSGPFELNPWSTDDLGAVIDDLARTTPFDYRELHTWNQTRTQVEHELRFYYGRVGVRRHGLRFVLGENIHTVPVATRGGDSFANHIRFLGAGEGRDMVLAEARMSDGRLRRMTTLDDKSVQFRETAQTRARRELERRQPLLSVTSVVVRDTPTTPLGSWEVGDEIRLQGELEWVDVDLWARVLSITVSPDEPELIGMSLVRADL